MRVRQGHRNAVGDLQNVFLAYMYYTLMHLESPIDI